MLKEAPKPSLKMAQIVAEIIEDEYGREGINALRIPPAKRTPWQQTVVEEIMRRIIGPDPRWIRDINNVLMR